MRTRFFLLIKSIHIWHNDCLSEQITMGAPAHYYNLVIKMTVNSMVKFKYTSTLPKSLLRLITYTPLSFCDGGCSYEYTNMKDQGRIYSKPVILLVTRFLFYFLSEGVHIWYNGCIWCNGIARMLIMLRTSKGYN